MSRTVSYDGFKHIVWALLPLVKEGKLGVEEFGRCTMLSFGDVSTVPSGMVSDTLTWTHEPTGRTYRSSKVTEEHFITRTTTCRNIARAYLAGELTEDKLNELIEKGRKVHIVSEQENLDLRPYQQSADYPSWESQYKAAGINLVPDPGTFGSKQYYYIVDGIPYADKHEAAAAHGVGTSTVVNRSRSEKWPTWEEYKYTDRN